MTFRSISSRQEDKQLLCLRRPRRSVQQKPNAVVYSLECSDAIWFNLIKKNVRLYTKISIFSPFSCLNRFLRCAWTKPTRLRLSTRCAPTLALPRRRAASRQAWQKRLAPPEQREAAQSSTEQVTWEVSPASLATYLPSPTYLLSLPPWQLQMLQNTPTCTHLWKWRWFSCDDLLKMNMNCLRNHQWKITFPLTGLGGSRQTWTFYCNYMFVETSFCK